MYLDEGTTGVIESTTITSDQSTLLLTDESSTTFSESIEKFTTSAPTENKSE